MSAVGAGSSALWDALVSARPPEQVCRFPGLGEYAAIRIADWNAEAYLPFALVRRADFAAQVTAAASVQALADAGYDRAPEGAGLLLGTAWSARQSQEKVIEQYLRRGCKGVHPSDFARASFNAPLGIAAMATGATGFSSALMCGTALGYAVDAVRAGRAPLVCAVGLSVYAASLHEAQAEMGGAAAAAGHPPSCRPWGKVPSGFVPGEIAVAVVVESAAHAAARGARIYAELCGYATQLEHGLGLRWWSPDPEGAALFRATLRALREAGTEPAQIGAVFSTANGTRVDQAEVSALCRVLGDRVRKVPVTSVKPVLGETYGANDALGAAVAALALHRHRMPPCGGRENGEETEIPLLIPDRAVELPDAPALVCCLDVGGVWNAFVLKPWTP